jgi:hypothetical protein
MAKKPTRKAAAKPKKRKPVVKAATKKPTKPKKKAPPPKKAAPKKPPRKPTRLTPSQKAARTRKANAKAAEQKKAARNARARQRRAELKLAEQIAAQQAPQDERETLVEILEGMTPVGFVFDLVEPEVAAQNRMPFVAVGRYSPASDEIGYADLYAVFASWKNDLALEAGINPQRIAAIRIVYIDPADVKGSGDSVVSHAGPWELVVSEAAHEVNPDNEDSLASRYADTVVPHFYVYFAAQIARGSSWIPHYQRPD